MRPLQWLLRHPVWGMGLYGLSVILLFVWFGLHPRQQRLEFGAERFDKSAHMGVFVGRPMLCQHDQNPKMQPLLIVVDDIAMTMHCFLLETARPVTLDRGWLPKGGDTLDLLRQDERRLIVQQLRLDALTLTLTKIHPK